jgi:hypothetical protein
MTLISKIILFVTPLNVNTPEMYHNKNFAPLYIPLTPQSSFNEAPPDLNPKNECNFNISSNLATKKIKHFTYDCSQPTRNWLLINISEANYDDVLHK